MSRRRIYLDHAATSWPKPPGVLEACVDYQTHLGVAASRGSYRSSQTAESLVASVRAQVASRIGVQHASGVAFTSNGTMALNAAILGFLHADDLSDVHVVTTATEHNSVLRPLAMLERTRGLQWTAVPCNDEGRISVESVRGALRPTTRLAILNHVSNVTGAEQPLASLVECLHAKKICILLDAAQSLGYVPLDAQSLGLDMVAAPLHKGACGMLGTGFLYVKESLEPQLQSPWTGGTGRSSDSLVSGVSWRESIEAGNLNLPALASVGAGLTWLAANPQSDAVWQSGGARILDAIARAPKLKLHGPPTLENRMPVFSVTSADMDCHEMAMLLDASLGIEVRSGFHCAASIHHYLGTQDLGGTLRFSLGHTSNDDDIEGATEGIALLGSL